MGYELLILWRPLHNSKSTNKFKEVTESVLQQQAQQAVATTTKTKQFYISDYTVVKTVVDK